MYTCVYISALYNNFSLVSPTRSLMSDEIFVRLLSVLAKYSCRLTITALMSSVEFVESRLKRVEPIIAVVRL